MSLKPMFPLKMVVFPGEKLNLHIFEPRYKQLINDCQNEKTTFFIPPVIDDELMPVATEMIIQRIENVYPDGKMDIRTLGKQASPITDFSPTLPGKLYGGAIVQEGLDEVQGDITKNIAIVRLAKQLHKLMNIKFRIPEKTEHGLCYKLGHHLGLNIQQEYRLIELQDEEQRQDYLIYHLEHLIPVVIEMNALREKVQQNGHFKNVIPPRM